MPTFKDAAEMVAWILAEGEYEPKLLLKEHIARIEKTERHLRLVTGDDELVVLALTKKKVAAG